MQLYSSIFSPKDSRDRQLKPLKPVKLHGLIGASMEWTEELWDEVVTYLDERLGLRQAVELHCLLDSLTYSGTGLEPGSEGVWSKRDNLAPFRDYPPTVLLGVFDFHRSARLHRR